MNRPFRRTRSKSRRLRLQALEQRQLLAADGLMLNLDSVVAGQNSDPIVIEVLANDSFDSDYVGNRQVTAVSTGSLGGRIEISADGRSIDYTAPADQSGIETFRYTVDDQQAAEVTVEIISPLSDFETTVDQFQDVYTFELLALAQFPSDYTGEQRITRISETARGSDIHISEDGQSVIYQVENNLAGKDSFSYIVDDLFVATANINVNNPLASDVYELIQNSGTTNLPILENDFQSSDLNSNQGVVSETLWASIRRDAKITHVLDDHSNEVTIADDGRSLQFTPAENQSGTRYFRYVVDGRFEQSIRVHIQRPVVNDYVTADMDGGAHTLDLLQNDEYHSALSNTAIRIVQQVTSVTQGDQGGTVEINDDGTAVIYSPAAGFVGSEQFEYVADGEHSATVFVYVSQPVREDRFTVFHHSSEPLDVLQNDFESDAGSTAMITSVTESTLGGTIRVDESGMIFYTPPEDLDSNGFFSDSFRYTVNDQYTASVSLSVRSPTSSDHYRFDLPIEKELRVLENDHLGVDYLGAGVITSVSPPSGGGTARISSDGQSLLYHPGSLGESFTYTVDDRFTETVNSSAISRLRLDTAVADQNGSAVVVDVLANDFPTPFNKDYGRYPGPRLLSADAESEQGGTVSVTADRKVNYVPPTDFVGQDSFTYHVDDFHSQTVTVYVIRRAADDLVHVDPDSQDNPLNVLANDIHGADYTGAGLISDVTSSTVGGLITIAEDRRSLTYTPAEGFAGEDTFVYTIDGRSRATVTVSVREQGTSPLDGFESTDEFRDFILGQAIQRYERQFGTPDYGPNPYYSYEPYYLAASDSARSADSPQFSETNVQVAGVDEHDIVETDGFHIYTLRGNELTIVRSLPADELEVVSRTQIEGNPVGMYLSGDRVTVISESTQQIDYPTYGYRFERHADSFAGYRSIYPGPPQPSNTFVTVIDVTDRTIPEVVSHTKFDGRFEDSRRIGDQVFLILKSDAVLPELTSTCDEDDTCTFESEDQYTQRVTENFASLIEETLPSYESFGSDGELLRGGPLLMPEDILRSSDEVTSITIVASINMASNESGLSAVSGVMADASTKLFASANSLYVFNNTIESIENEPWTGILKFDWNGETGAIDFAATGRVPGRLLNQFAADELDGQLRLTTEVSNSYTGNHSGNAETAVFVLEDDEGVLEFVGSMQNLAVGQNIKSVRYFGDRAFVTTFDTIDPLTAIDLSDPSGPRALGHVPIPGFSSYMQFTSPDRLLTIGTNTATGFGGRAMVSLFDVSDLTSPRLVDQHNLPRFSTSEANNDHHAFGWFANHELLSVPMARYFTERFDADEDGYKEAYRQVREDELTILHVGVNLLGNEAITPRGQVPHEGKVQRSVAINDFIYSVGDDGVRVVGVDDANTVIDEAIFDWEIVIDDTPWGLVDHADIGTAARELLVQKGMQGGDLLLVTQERQAGEVTVVMRSGTEHFRLQGTDATDLALTDEAFQFTKNFQHNAAKPMDVDNDGEISALDALLVINEMNRQAEGAPVVDPVLRQVNLQVDRYFDTNADSKITALDALRIINELSRQELQGAPTSDPTGSPTVGIPSADSVLDDESDRERPDDLVTLF